MNRPENLSVVIAGAGIGGLTAALSLHAAGIEATVVESARALRPLGVGINLLPHAVRELAELGLADELSARAIPITENVYADRDGNRLWTEPRGTASGYRWDQYAVHRGELQMLLLAAVRQRLGADAVRTGIRLDGFDHGAEGVNVRLANRATGTDEYVHADLLIGADGLHSRVLEGMHPRRPPLRWSGVTMWRGMGAGPPFLSGHSMTVAVDDNGTRLIAYPVIDPAGGQARTNWVALVPIGDPGPLDGAAAWNEPGNAEEVLPHYTGWDLGWLDVPGLIRHSDQILRYPMIDRDPLGSWTSRRVTLLGDAAHLMYPIGANGGSQAILDGRTLAYHLATAADLRTALVRYENARRPATTATVSANREMDRAQRVAADESAHDHTSALAAITGTYRHATGSDPNELNARPSLTPDRPTP